MSKKLILKILLFVFPKNLQYLYKNAKNREKDLCRIFVCVTFSE